MTAGMRNALIVVAIAIAVFAIPGGGRAASFVGAVLGIAISAAFALIAARFYRENRVAIFSLGDRHRGLFYGAIAVAVLAMAARQRLWQTGAGLFFWLVLIAAASFAVYEVVRRYREYG